MRRYKNNILCFVISFLFVLILYPSNVSLASLIDSGTCGNGLTWTLDEDGVLTISGSGAMYDWYSSSVPWKKSKEKIKTVIFDGTITSIGQCAFYECKNLTQITLPNSISSIGNEAFSKCINLTSINIPLKSLNKKTFISILWVII